MALPGEVVRGESTSCMDCETELKLRVLRSAAGYYLGFFCPNCGPYSRQSGYFSTYEQADKARYSGANWR